MLPTKKQRNEGPQTSELANHVADARSDAMAQNRVIIAKGIEQNHLAIMWKLREGCRMPKGQPRDLARIWKTTARSSSNYFPALIQANSKGCPERGWLSC